MSDNQTVILRVQLDEGKTEERLQSLVLDIEKTKQAQAMLNLTRKAGSVTEEEYTKKTVALRAELKAQQQEQTALTKNLELYRTATGDLANTYKGTQAQLSLAQRQYQELQGSQDNSTESTKSLSEVIDGLRNTLKATDAQQSLFARNIGNYPKNGNEGLEKLVQQLVTLQEEQKRYVVGSEEEVKVRQRIGFFQQAAAQAGAKEGKTYEETTDFVRQYGEAIRPATADLIKLTEQQEQLAQSAEDVGEDMQQIGFKIGQSKAAIQAATDALKEVPEVAADGAKETKGLGAGLLEAAQSSDVLGGAIEVVTGAKEKYTVAANLAKAATAGEVTVLGALKLALLATGLGLFVVVLGSVVAFLTKTQAGTDFLNRKMAALGAGVRIVTNLFVDLGGKIVAAAENPKQAFEDLVSFIETNLGNRLKAFGVLLDAVRNRDFKKLVDGTVQLTTGITDATAKAKAFTQQIDAAAGSAERLAQMERDLQRAEDDNIDTNKRLLNEVERLKNVRDNEFNTIKQRQAANEAAYKVEMQREATLADLATKRVDLLRAQIEQEGGRERVSRERFQELKNAENELVDIREDAAGKQNELITNRYQLEQESLDKVIERRAQANALEIALLNRQLAQVQINSDRELSLRQQLLNKGREAELNVKNLTVRQKQAIDTKYEQDSLTLTLDFNRRRLQAALAAQADLTSAQLSAQQAGSAEALRLQAQQIEEQRRAQIAALVVNTDNTAATAKINAAAEAQQRQLEYQQATQDLKRFLDGKRDAIELDYAKGLILEGEYQRQLAAVARSGTDAQTVINSDYLQSNEENQQQVTQNEIEAARRHTAEVKRQEEVKQEIKDATLQSAQRATDTIITLFGEESGAGVAALAIKKTLALAEIAINLQKELAANKLAGAQIAATIPIVGPALGTAYIIAKDALSIASAAAGAAAVLKLQDGGIAEGPSHAQGGIPLYRGGRPAGIEIEGREAVLTKRVTDNPLLLTIASAINQLAGGRPLVPNFPMPHMALGGVAQPLALEQLRGSAGESFDYPRLAEELQKVKIYTKTQETMASINNVAYTQQVGSD